MKIWEFESISECKLESLRYFCIELGMVFFNLYARVLRHSKATTIATFLLCEQKLSFMSKNSLRISSSTLNLKIWTK